MDAQLLEEFDETVALVKKARRKVKDDPVIEGQRGGAKCSPWVIVLRDQQAHLVRIARILTARNQEVPIPAGELEKLLD